MLSSSYLQKSRNGGNRFNFVTHLPQVSVVVRSMGRNELRAALDSIARQDYPNIEIIVVDATGGRHPPLPHIEWKAGHVVRMVSTGQPLLRQFAAQVGLDSIRGEFFCFLDDDDEYLPHHVSTLVPVALASPRTNVVYARGNLLNPDGSVEKVFGFGFNRMLLYYGPLCYWQTALIRTRVREFGCRFDPALPIMEDRDFLHQIAEWGDFMFVDAITFNYRADIGTSGTGNGPNRDDERLVRFDALLRAKWSAQSDRATARALALCTAAFNTYFSGDITGALNAFESVLDEYPDDPNAVHAIAKIRLDGGEPALALRHARLAVERNPFAAEFRLTLAQVLAANGDLLGAIDHARPIADDEIFGRDARLLVAQCVGAPSGERAADASSSRNALCSCGSGRRFKQCHGKRA